MDVNQPSETFVIKFFFFAQRLINAQLKKVHREKEKEGKRACLLIKLFSKIALRTDSSVNVCFSIETRSRNSVIALPGFTRRGTIWRVHRKFGRLIYAVLYISACVYGYDLVAVIIYSNEQIYLN